jgi:hypothetical protein
MVHETILPTATGGPVIACLLGGGWTNGAGNLEDRSPYYGKINDAGDDYLGFKRVMTAIVVAAAGSSLDVGIQQLGSAITDLTSDEIGTMGAAGGLSTDGTRVIIQRLDTPGYVRLVQPVAAAFPTNGVSLTFGGKVGETGTSGVTLTAGAATLAAGTYAITVAYSIDVFWG